MTVIYIDTLFLLNLIMNYLLLLVTAKIAGETFSRIRLLLAAIVGAAYAVAVFLPGLGFLTAVASKLVVAAAMVLVAFRRSKAVIRLTLVFFGISFAFAGCVLALYFFTGQGSLHNGVPYVPVNMKVLLLSAAACYLLLSLTFRRTARHGAGKRDLTEVEIRRGSRTVRLTALLDTGNTLADPVSNQPVVVAEAEAVRALIPTELLSVLGEESLKRPVEAMENLALLGAARQFRLIPYRAVGVDCGMLLALRADELKLNGEARGGALVALSPTRLSDGGAYRALAGLCP